MTWQRPRNPASTAWHPLGATDNSSRKIEISVQTHGEGVLPTMARDANVVPENLSS